MLLQALGNAARRAAQKKGQAGGTSKVEGFTSPATDCSRTGTIKPYSKRIQIAGVKKTSAFSTGAVKARYAEKCRFLACFEKS
jgi:hypothetical protein